MEGLEISVINYSTYLESYRHRLDSEYYRKDCLKNETYLQGIPIIEMLSKDKLINVKSLNLNKPFNYLAIGDVNLLTLNYSVSAVNPDEIPDRATYVLKSNDIVVSTVRPNRNAVALIKTPKRLVGTSGFTVLRPDASKINPFFLYVFCKTKFFITKLTRENTATMYPAVTDFDILNVKVPFVSTQFQTEIEKIIDRSYSKIDESKSLYLSAENHLVELIGLGDFKPSKKSVNIKSFKESVNSDRLDAEFYQFKYDELVNKLHSTKRSIPLNELLDFNQRGKQPDYLEDEGLYVLNSKNVRKNKIDFKDARRGDDSGTPKSLIIRKNDVLMNGTGVGTIGRCAPYLYDDDALPDNHITILRSSKINPIFLAVTLNSIIGQMQVEKYYKGSSGQIEIYPTDINQFIIWNAPEEVQRTIANFILAAYELENESQRLVQHAIHAVEMAIETNEANAIKFINKKSKINE